MSQIQTPVLTDTWLAATWEEYLRVTSDPAGQKTKGYYHNGQMRIESMAALGNPHSRDHFIVMAMVSLFASLRSLDLDGHDNCTYRKIGCTELQPDASFYLGTKSEAIPWNTTIIDLDIYPPPDLVIEVAYSSLADDKGEKRLIYETLGIREYWIVDVQRSQVIAFAIANNGSHRITHSHVLPGLDIALLEEAFQRSRQMNHGKVSSWFMAQIANLP
ncbi:MAG: Uma2 family endonuclease [Aphanocapsa sp. GSE-SYN-MK-11-07L]|jgi:Uma2 family endonuclease|nr:Uma2 family endonuclease [Aphanocapsa sp. GSE-SYN-MK-11-07L]